MIPYLGPELIRTLLRDDGSPGSSQSVSFNRGAGPATQNASVSPATSATAGPSGQTIISADRQTLEGEAKSCNFLQAVEPLGSSITTHSRTQPS